MLGLLNAIGLPSLDALEDFIFLHGAAVLVPASEARGHQTLDETQTQMLATVTSREDRHRQRKVELTESRQELTRLKAELKYATGRMEAERVLKDEAVRDLKRLLDGELQNDRATSPSQQSVEHEPTATRQASSAIEEEIHKLRSQLDDAFTSRDAAYAACDREGSARQDAEMRASNEKQRRIALEKKIRQLQAGESSVTPPARISARWATDSYALVKPPGLNSCRFSVPDPASTATPASLRSYRSSPEASRNASKLHDTGSDKSVAAVPVPTTTQGTQTEENCVRVGPPDSVLVAPAVQTRQSVPLPRVPTEQSQQALSASAGPAASIKAPPSLALASPVQADHVGQGSSKDAFAKATAYPSNAPEMSMSLLVSSSSSSSSKRALRPTASACELKRMIDLYQFLWTSYEHHRAAINGRQKWFEEQPAEKWTAEAERYSLTLPARPPDLAPEDMPRYPELHEIREGDMRETYRSLEVAELRLKNYSQSQQDYKQAVAVIYKSVRNGVPIKIRKKKLVDGSVTPAPNHLSDRFTAVLPITPISASQEAISLRESRVPGLIGTVSPLRPKSPSKQPKLRSLSPGPVRPESTSTNRVKQKSPTGVVPDALDKSTEAPRNITPTLAATPAKRTRRFDRFSLVSSNTKSAARRQALAIQVGRIEPLILPAQSSSQVTRSTSQHRGRRSPRSSSPVHRTANDSDLADIENVPLVPSSSSSSEPDTLPDSPGLPIAGSAPTSGGRQSTDRTTTRPLGPIAQAPSQDAHPSSQPHSYGQPPVSGIDDIFAVKREQQSQIPRFESPGPSPAQQAARVGVYRLPSPDDTPRLSRFGARLVAGVGSPPAPAANWQAINADHDAQRLKRPHRDVKNEEDDSPFDDDEVSARKKLRKKDSAASNETSATEVKVEICNQDSQDEIKPLVLHEDGGPRSDRKPLKERRDSMDSASEHELDDGSDEAAAAAKPHAKVLTNSQEYRARRRTIRAQRQKDREHREALQAAR